MTEKPYSLETLKLICGGTASSINETLPWHVLQEDGLYLDRSQWSNQGCDSPNEVAVIRWHPRRDSELPALPIPFSARELGAFILAGVGVFLLERFELDDVLDEKALAELDVYARNAVEAIREAFRLRKEAIEMFGSTADGVNKAADWLLRKAPEPPTEPGPLAAAPSHSSAAVKPLQRSAAQGAAVLNQITSLGYDPLALPQNPPGKDGVKAEVRKALSRDRLFAGVTVFDKAWERLSANREIVIHK